MHLDLPKLHFDQEKALADTVKKQPLTDGERKQLIVLLGKLDMKSCCVACEETLVGTLVLLSLCGHPYCALCRTGHDPSSYSFETCRKEIDSNSSVV